MEKFNSNNNSYNTDIFSSISIRESGADTIKFLQNKIEKMKEEYNLNLKIKDTNIKELQSQMVSLNEYIRELKNKYQEVNEEVIQEQLISKIKVEEAKNALEKQKESHKKEMKLLSELLERSKFEIENLVSKINIIQKEKNELKNKLNEIENIKLNLEDKSKLLENKISENKKAVEETLTGLFEERNKNEDLLKKIKEKDVENLKLKKEIEDIRFNLDAERKEWRELWERERSVWETHRQEFAVWEERLRSEREAWLSKLKKEEEKGIDYAQNISNILKESSKWSDKVTQILKLYATKGVELPKVFVTPNVIKNKVISPFRRVIAFSLVSLLLLTGLSIFIYDYNSKIHFSKLMTYPLENLNYTAILQWNNDFVLSHWSDGLVFKNDNNQVIKSLNSFSNEKLKISAITKAGSNFWVLDMSQLRFVEIDPSGNILRVIKTVGPAPQGLAFDGFNLWSFDASTSLLYKYSLGEKVNGIMTYNLNGIKNISSLEFVKNQLFVLSDYKLFRYKFKNENFKQESKQNLKDAISFYLDNNKILVLKNNGAIKSLDLYEIKK